MLPDSQGEWTSEDSLTLDTDRNFHAPYVVGLEFQYFDGTEWVSEWNSWKEKKLPQLVEVIFQIEVDKDIPSARRTTTSTGLQRSETADEEEFSTERGTTYRQIIALPLADKPSPIEIPDQETAPTDFMTSKPVSRGRRP